MRYKCGFAPANMYYDPVTAAIVITGAVTAGVSASQAHQQQKAAKTAASVAAEQQNKLIKAAEEKSAGEDATTSSAIAKARQKALAASIAAQGRASTIATGSQGVTGQAQGTTKTLIGE